MKSIDSIDDKSGYSDTGMVRLGQATLPRTSSLGGTVGVSDQTGWYEAMARAWGSALDKQADRISTLSEGIGNGVDNPSQAVMLSAESMRMQFISNAANTAQTSVGHALEKLGSKQ